MTAGIYDFTIEKNATYTRSFAWKDENGAPINLTGYSAKLQVRQAPTSPVLAEFSTDNGRIVISATPADGTFVVSMTDEDTASLDFSAAHYDLVMQSAGGVKVRLIEGRVNVTPGITQ